MGNNGHTKGYPIWNKGLTKETSESIRKQRETYQNNKKLGLHKKPGHIWSEDEKKKLSEKRKKWLLEHPEKHVWKYSKKFMSEPCEKLKNFLKSKKINFVEEYTPFENFNYCIDIAFPDEKIGIEVNGNQHYNNDGTLKDYYQKRHNILEENGWKIFEIHYTKCFNINISDFKDILELPIYDKDYIGKYFSKKELLDIKKQQLIKQKLIDEFYKCFKRFPTFQKNGRLQKEDRNALIIFKNKEKRQKLIEERKPIIINAIKESKIDFSKSGWVGKFKKYLKEHDILFDNCIHRMFLKYYPEFIELENVWKRNSKEILEMV